MYIEKDFLGEIAIHGLSDNEAASITNALRYATENNLSLDNREFIQLLEDLINKTLKEL